MILISDTSTALPVQTGQLKIATLTFDVPLKPEEMTTFRKALEDKIGFSNPMFQNQLTKPGHKTLHRYPRIQYRIHEGYAQLWGVEEGAAALLRYLQDQDKTLGFQGRTHYLNIKDFKMQEVKVGLTPHYYDYSLMDWMALNGKKYASWMKDDALISKVEFLEQQLAKTINGFLNEFNLKPVGTESTAPEPVKILEIYRWKKQFYHEFPYRAFNLNFRTRLLLPPGLCIGKGISEGYGRVSILPSSN